MSSLHTSLTYIFMQTNKLIKKIIIIYILKTAVIMKPRKGCNKYTPLLPLSRYSLLLLFTACSGGDCVIKSKSVFHTIFTFLLTRTVVRTFWKEILISFTVSTLEFYPKSDISRAKKRIKFCSMFIRHYFQVLNFML